MSRSSTNVDTNQIERLSYLSDDVRLQAYKSLIGVDHLWSKNVIQREKVQSVLSNLMNLAENDPEFLARFLSYVYTKTDSKDLKVLTAFANSLSDADGTPFSPGSEYKKPNFRVLSAAAIQELDPKLLKRLVSLAQEKQSLGTRWREGVHFSKHLRTAVKKYIRFREMNPQAIESIKKSGLANTFTYLYGAVRIAPSIDTAAVLGWKQSGYVCTKCGSTQGKAKGDTCKVCGGTCSKIKISKKSPFNFKGMTPLQIAEKIRSEKLSPIATVGALNGKMEPVIAAAILEQASGDEAVILRGMFDQQGLLKHKEVVEVFTEKIKTAKTALDRVDRINTEIDEAVANELKKARSKKRKEVVGDIGKIFLHIDVSGSMEAALAFAKKSGAIFAECVANPEQNFHWGLFNASGTVLPVPKTFTQDAFEHALYGKRCGGGTDCLALYERARQIGCDVDVYITDEDHNGKPVSMTIRECDAKGLGRPKAVVIVSYAPGRTKGFLTREFESMGIPVTVVQPNKLTESALVPQLVKEALKGPLAVIDEIMATPFIKMPYWWESVKVK